MNIPTKFQHIGIIGRQDSQQVIETVERIITYLTPLDHDIMLHHIVAKGVSNYQGAVGQRQDIAKKCDLVIVVGGDGSMLAAARVMATHGVPILGVNRGKLGFLTDISPDQVEEKLALVIAGDYAATHRFMLSAKVIRDGKEVARGSGLNDIVLHPGQSARMLSYDMGLDADALVSYRADGLIIATPTGSTAYALSAGGPIMHPSLDAIALVPMHPHNLTSRPIVVGAETVITVTLGEDNQTQPILSFDGQVQVNCQQGDTIMVQKHLAKLCVLHPSGYSFYERCRSKLGWHVGTTNH